MALTPEQQEAIKDILYAVFHDSAFRDGFVPTEATLLKVEVMFLEMAKCNSRIKKLLASLPCVIIKRGFLARCLRSVQKIVQQDKGVFRMCSRTAKYQWKRDIYLSGI